jgi:hypothetical protein
MSEKRRLENLRLLHPTCFRHDVGSGYPYDKKKEFKAKKDGVFPVKKGDIIVKNPSRIHYGIERGAGDLIGWTEVSVTPEMVGQKVGIFTSIEDKSATDRIGLEQIIWVLNNRLSGCIAEVYKEGHKLTLDQILKHPRRDKDKRLEGIVERLTEKVLRNTCR